MELYFQKFENNCDKNRLCNELSEIYSFRTVKSWVSLPKETYDTQSDAWLSKTSLIKKETD